MKMLKEDYSKLEDTFKKHKKDIEEYKEYARENFKYNNLDVLVGFAGYRQLMDEDFKNRQRKNGLVDSHIETAVKRAMKAIYK